MVEVTLSEVAGFDFGLKIFLACSDGPNIESPQFLNQLLNVLRKASHNHSCKKRGSKSYEKARFELFRIYERVMNQRTDWFWKLAHDLTDWFDVLCFETLTLDGLELEDQRRCYGRCGSENDQNAALNIK